MVTIIQRDRQITTSFQREEPLSHTALIRDDSLADYCFTASHPLTPRRFQLIRVLGPLHILRLNEHWSA